MAIHSIMSQLNETIYGQNEARLTNSYLTEENVLIDRPRKTC